MDFEKMMEFLRELKAENVEQFFIEFIAFYPVEVEKAIKEVFLLEKNNFRDFEEIRKWLETK